MIKIQLKKDLGDALDRAQLARPVMYMLAAVMAIRLIAVFFMGPMPQDAYYFFYSQHPSLSYFDHPPAIAYLLWLFTGVFGKNVVAIKLADTFITLLTVIAVYKLSRGFSGRYKPETSVVLLLSTLMISVLSLVSTPDTPLLFFWTVSLIALRKAIFLEQKYWWLLSGILMGLAFDSKYTAVFLPAGTVLFLLFSARYRRLFWSIWPWLGLLLMVLAAAPVIIWNVENNFASFAFQGAQRAHDAAAFELKPKFIFGLVGHQLALLMPVLLIAIVFAAWRLVSKGRQLFRTDGEDLFLLCFFLPIFLAFLSLSPIYWIKINWMMPAYVTGAILASGVISQKWFRIQLIISLVVHLCLIVEVLFYPVPISSDDTWTGWKQLHEKVQMLKDSTHVGFVFSADSYKTSAELNLYSNEFIYGQNVIGQHALHFDYIGTNLSRLKGLDALYIDSDPRFKSTDPMGTVPVDVSSYFTNVKELEPIFIKKRGRTVRKFYVFLCTGYKGPKR